MAFELAVALAFADALLEAADPDVDAYAAGDAEFVVARAMALLLVLFADLDLFEAFNLADLLALVAVLVAVSYTHLTLPTIA